jgi:hypothetical protein
MFKATHKNGGVSVTNQRGELVCYVRVEKTYMAPTIATNPDEAYQAGEAADQAIDCAARNAGASSVVLVLPSDLPPQPGERWIRIIERPIAQTVTMPEVGRNAQPTAPYIN